MCGKEAWGSISLSVHPNGVQWGWCRALCRPVESFHTSIPFIKLFIKGALSNTLYYGGPPALCQLFSEEVHSQGEHTLDHTVYVLWCRYSLHEQKQRILHCYHCFELELATVKVSSLGIEEPKAHSYGHSRLPSFWYLHTVQFLKGRLFTNVYSSILLHYYVLQ